jgi:hypothetical protein
VLFDTLITVLLVVVVRKPLAIPRTSAVSFLPFATDRRLRAALLLTATCNPQHFSWYIFEYYESPASPPGRRSLRLNHSFPVSSELHTLAHSSEHHSPLQRHAFTPGPAVVNSHLRIVRNPVGQNDSRQPYDVDNLLKAKRERRMVGRPSISPPVSSDCSLVNALDAIKVGGAIVEDASHGPGHFKDCFL